MSDRRYLRGLLVRWMVEGGVSKVDGAKALDEYVDEVMLEKAKTVRERSADALESIAESLRVICGMEDDDEES